MNYGLVEENAAKGRLEWLLLHPANSSLIVTIIVTLILTLTLAIILTAFSNEVISQLILRIEVVSSVGWAGGGVQWEG